MLPCRQHAISATLPPAAGKPCHDLADRSRGRASHIARSGEAPSNGGSFDAACALHGMHGTLQKGGRAEAAHAKVCEGA